MNKLYSTTHEDQWLNRATEQAIAFARNVIDGAEINKRAPVGSLSNNELGWIISAAIFGWCQCKAQQAVEEGSSAEPLIRTTYGNPAAWEYGVVRSTLRVIGDLPHLEWKKPIGEWPQEHVVTLGWAFYKLVDAALAARDVAADGLIAKPSIEARRVNGAAGNSLVTADEIPF